MTASVEAARLATSADVAWLDQLASSAREELTQMRGGRLFYAREAVPGAPSPDDPDRPVWVGTIDGTPVGFASAHVETLRDGTILGVIDSLFVEADAREAGVGEELMNAMLGWFRSRNCAAADAIALPGARETKNFFESAGFSARLLVMHHKFDDQ